MGSLGKVRIGHRAPDFHCEAVTKGLIKEVSLADYISEKNPQWLIVLFIPAAFSFVCPTEVQAFHKCLDEFRDRNCNVVFVSVDTKHSLWHWQNVPKQYGGLGGTDIPLLSDACHKMGRDYGVLVEEEGVCLRGMFIMDDKAIVQQITLNNLTVGRSVLEALRLLEAYQAVDKHGVLCPIDWKPSSNTTDTMNTISNTLTESYDERLANLQKEFGHTQVTDLDSKHGTLRRADSEMSTKTVAGSNGQISNKEKGNDSATLSTKWFNTDRSPSKTTEGIEPESAPAPVPRPMTPTPKAPLQRPPLLKTHSSASLTRLSRVQSGGLIPPHKPNHPLQTQHNAYRSCRGSQVFLEFADPTSSLCSDSSSIQSDLNGMPYTTFSKNSSSSSCPTHRSMSNLSPSVSASSMGNFTPTPSPQMPRSAPQTRLQMTFDAIRKIGGMSSSPSVSPDDHGGEKQDDPSRGVIPNSSDEGPELGYFDVETKE